MTRTTQDTPDDSDGAQGDRGARVPGVSTEASSDCGAITCGMLAEMIENVAGRFTTDCAIEAAIEDIQEADMAVIEWICRLVPASVIEALKAHASSPLWGEGAPTAAGIAFEATP